MANPLIIFGAGASHDYSPIEKLAPLTNELTQNRFLHTDLLKRYRGAGDLLSDVVQQVRTRGRSFEEVLTEMKGRTAHSAQMMSQFAALEFYLKELFRRVSTPSDTTALQHQINNYRSVANRIRTYCDGKATVVTFNYDSLFEDNLGTPMQSMSDYVNGDLKIIKLHGSYNWVYVQPRSLMNNHEGLSDYEWYLQNPDFIDGIQKKPNVSPYHEMEIQELSDASEYAGFPAIAVPLMGKDRYVSPPKHIQVLEKVLPQVDRILIIGWKAGDSLLLSTLACYLPKRKFKILVVSGTLQGAQEIATIVEEKLYAQGLTEARGGGFTEFMADDSSHRFFTHQ